MSKKLNLLSALGIFLIGLFSANTSQAQLTNYIWNNSSATWTNTTSWSPSWAGDNNQAQSNNIAVFSNTANAFTTIDLSSNRTVGGIFFTTNALTYTFNSANSKVLTIWDKGLTGIYLGSKRAMKRFVKTSFFDNFILLTVFIII
jgi:hypothetical protein